MSRTLDEALLEASRQGNTRGICALLTLGKVDINVQDEDGWTPLMWAVYGDHLSTVALLLEHDYSLNMCEKKNNKGQTALMLGLIKGCQSQIVALLITHVGADIDDKDNRGWNALAYAVYYDSGDNINVEFLLRNGAKIEDDYNGKSIYELATHSYKPEETIKMLRKYGAK